MTDDFCKDTWQRFLISEIAASTDRFSPDEIVMLAETPEAEVAFGYGESPEETADMLIEQYGQLHKAGGRRRVSDQARTPTPAMQSAAREGLRLVSEGYGGRGLRPETLAWARRIATGKPIPHARIVTMRAWFARHAVDKRPGWRERKTPGWVAHQLWGGDAGRAWANKIA